MRATRLNLLAPILICLLPSVWGHGRLIEPPSRASAWRYGFSTPPDYNDHELYCGGFARQQQRNKGKCGVCGDPWDLPPPRPHELGGAYGQGVIVRRYPRNGVVTIRVELTANHNGHFEFKLCTDYKNTTQECLDKHVLKLANSKLRSSNQQQSDDPLGYRFYPKDGNKIYEMRYRLPDLHCKHCVLQWIYLAGNNWGGCPNGTEAVGCGPQEEFRACADISIGGGQIYVPTDTPTIVNTSEKTPSTTLSTLNFPPSNRGPRGLTTLLIVSVALLLVLGVLALLYSYYYQVGKRVKAWLTMGKNETKVEVKSSLSQGLPPPPKCAAPLPPPRVRRAPSRSPQPHMYNGHRMYNVNLANESLA